MKRNRTIHVKAIFLLGVFSLNTLIGFACALGVNMGFNAGHHHHHHHEGAAHHHHGKTAKAGKAGEDNNCCKDDVVKLSQSDKLLAHAINAGVEMPVMLVHLHFLYESYFSSFTQGHGQLLQVLRPFVPDSRWIRVSIQSFQI